MDAIKPNELQQLTDVRNALLHLHKALLDGQRARYEREHGAISSPSAFLQLAISDPAFDWLHRFSELVVEIDESTDGDEPLTSDAGSALLEQARQLLSGKPLGDAVSGNIQLRQQVDDLMKKLG